MDRWQEVATGPAELASALREALAIARGLSVLHEIGTHHGDVSADNVLLQPSGEPVLIDLGQVGRLGRGTPGFVAPEVLSGAGGPSADRFSLGCLLCWRIFGRLPWPSLQALATYTDSGQREEALRALEEESGVSLPRPVRALLQRLLSLRPEDRLGDTRELTVVLGELAQAHESGWPRVERPRWWIPSRWPYLGPSLTETVEELRADAGRVALVAIEGPSHSGRAQVVEELLQRLQELGSPPVSSVGKSASSLPT